MGKHATNAIDRIRELWAPIYNNNNNNSAEATVPPAADGGAERF